MEPLTIIDKSAIDFLYIKNGRFKLTVLSVPWITRLPVSKVADETLMKSEEIEYDYGEGDFLD